MSTRTADTLFPGMKCYIEIATTVNHPLRQHSLETEVINVCREGNSAIFRIIKNDEEDPLVNEAFSNNIPISIDFDTAGGSGIGIFEIPDTYRNQHQYYNCPGIYWSWYVMHIATLGLLFKNSVCRDLGFINNGSSYIKYDIKK